MFSDYYPSVYLKSLVFTAKCLVPTSTVFDGALISSLSANGYLLPYKTLAIRDTRHDQLLDNWHPGGWLDG